MTEEKLLLNFIEQINSRLIWPLLSLKTPFRFPPDPMVLPIIGLAAFNLSEFWLVKAYAPSSPFRLMIPSLLKRAGDWDAISESMARLQWYWMLLSGLFQQSWLGVQLIKEGKAYVANQSAELGGQKGCAVSVCDPSKVSVQKTGLLTDEEWGFESGSYVLRAKSIMAFLHAMVTGCVSV